MVANHPDFPPPPNPHRREGDNEAPEQERRICTACQRETDKSQGNKRQVRQWVAFSPFELLALLFASAMVNKVIEALFEVGLPF